MTDQAEIDDATTHETQSDPKENPDETSEDTEKSPPETKEETGSGNSSGEERNEDVDPTVADDSKEVVNALEEPFSEEGFELFQGREYISLRENGVISANKGATENYLAGKESVALLFNEASNELALIPLETTITHPGVVQIRFIEDHAEVSARGFFKQHGLDLDQTVRHSPEWREDVDIGIEGAEGGLIIDLEEDGEKISWTQEETSKS